MISRHFNGTGSVLALAIGLAWSTSAPAAQDLKSLYEAARGYDMTFLSARALLDSARYRVAQARGTNLPTIGLQLSATRTLSDNTPGQVTSSASSNDGNATLLASQPIFNRANSIAITQAERAEEMSHADFEVAEQDLILRVAQAYFDVLAAKDTLATSQGSLNAIAEQVASVKRNFELGSATVTDGREVQARYDLARATLLQAENGLVTSRVVLDALVGGSNVDPKPLAVPVTLPTTAAETVDSWVGKADANHPLIRRAKLTYDVAKLESDKARAGHLPTAALRANYGRGTQSSFGILALEGFPEGTVFSQHGAYHSASVGVVVNIPIFSGLQVQNRVKETLALEDRSSDELQAQRRSVAQTTRTAFYMLQSGAAQVGALEAAEASGLLALQSTRRGYELGVRVNMDVLNAQAQIDTTQAQLAKARYDLILDGLRLRQAAGSVTADDVAAVNGLLGP